MSDAAIAEITEGFRNAIGGDSGLNAKLKFDFEGAGQVFIDGRSSPMSVAMRLGPILQKAGGG